MSNRESVAAVAVTEAVIAGLFGVEAAPPGGGPAPSGAGRTVVSPFGELRDVRTA